MVEYIAVISGEHTLNSQTHCTQTW